MKGVTIEILTQGQATHGRYTIHCINGIHDTRPPQPLEAENWGVPDYP